MPAEPSRAVFLSYASQDAEAARRICETLRGAGVETWFDADGGLEHGDEWDAKIRKQIKECVLFIPIISAHTQARLEGYFRLEWELAAQRAMSIASGVPFILPVVIDETREPEALVPDRFRAVQWTKLPGGVVTPEVKARYLRLWSHRVGTMRAGDTGGAKGDRGQETGDLGQEKGAGLAPVPRRPSRVSRWLVPTVAGSGIIVAAIWFIALRDRPSAANAKPQAQDSPPASATVPFSSEAAQLVRQARDIIYDPDSARNEFALAENLLKRATDLAPASGEAWAASALLNHYFYSRGYDQNRPRLVRSQAEAEKALRLDPRNVDGLLALGLHRQALGESERARDYLDRAHAGDPQNYKVILAQSLLEPDPAARARFLITTAEHVAQPAELYYYAALERLRIRRFAQAAQLCDRAIAAQPFWRALVLRAGIEKLQTADATRMIALLDRVPEAKQDEPRVAILRYHAAMIRRDFAGALRALSAVAVENFEDNFFTGPKAMLLAPAHELAGQPERAREQWQIAERAVREKLAANPGDLIVRIDHALILAGLRRDAEAKAAADACAADERLARTYVDAMELLAETYLRLGDYPRAIEFLRRSSEMKDWGFVSAALLAADPRWAVLREQPGYPELLAAFKRSERDDVAGATAKEK